jgi:hypothetical protein
MPLRRHLEDLFGGQTEQSWRKGIEYLKMNAPGAALVDLTEALVQRNTGAWAITKWRKYREDYHSCPGERWGQ